MSTETQLVVNGEARTFANGAMPVTVAQLLETLSLPHEAVVAEVNGSIVKRDEFSSHCLASGDRIEIVKLVGGG